MIRKLAGSIREYKTSSLLTLLLMVGEVFFEVLIPFITADMVNNIKAGAPMADVLKTGLVLLAMAMVSWRAAVWGALPAPRPLPASVKTCAAIFLPGCRASPLRISTAFLLPLW